MLTRDTLTWHDRVVAALAFAGEVRCCPAPPLSTICPYVRDAAVEDSRDRPRQPSATQRALGAGAAVRSARAPAAELRHVPRRGSAFLREAVDEVGAGAWSAPEARAATLMRRAGLPPFRQNVRIDLPDGSYYVADVLWDELRAILEIDSDSHHSLAGADVDGTSDRHLLLETLGYSVVHRSPRLIVKHPARFVDGIARWLRAREGELRRR